MQSATSQSPDSVESANQPMREQMKEIGQLIAIAIVMTMLGFQVGCSTSSGSDAQEAGKTWKKSEGRW
jgi:predicted RND superfamily exporter protein